MTNPEEETVGDDGLNDQPGRITTALAHEIHQRWIKRSYQQKPPNSEGCALLPQCGGCVYYINLVTPLGSDWGACTNIQSAHDGTVMFEHDWCPSFAKDPIGWR